MKRYKHRVAPRVRQLDGDTMVFESVDLAPYMIGGER